MLKKQGDPRFIGASLGSATGGVPQNDRAFASLGTAIQSAEYTICTKTSPLKKPLPQMASRSANGLLIVQTESQRWMFPSGRCAWTPPNCQHAARSVGGAAGAMVDLSPEMCRGLPKTPCVFNSSELLFAMVHRMVDWDLRQPLNPAKKHLITTLRDEIRQPDQQPLRLTIPKEERLARVAEALLDDVADDRTLDAWAHVAGMARRTFMRAFSAHAGMSFGRWRQQARLFAALEMLAQRKSVTEVAIAVGYDSVSAFIEMFRTMLGTTPQTYLRITRS